ncbi:hypothetical protein GCM10027089_40120 [Nocardia thraciensis]
MPRRERPDDGLPQSPRVIARRVEPTVPPRVHYRLTDLGLSLEVPLSALRAWAEEHMAEIDDQVGRG